MNSNNALYNGEVIPIKPSMAVLTEFTLNGWTPEEIDRELSMESLKNEEDVFPLEGYKGGVGYMFDWGHVIEKLSPPDDGVPCYLATWEFCLDEILSRAHRSGMHLSDLCDICFEYLDNLDSIVDPDFQTIN